MNAYFWSCYSISTNNRPADLSFLFIPGIFLVIILSLLLLNLFYSSKRNKILADGGVYVFFCSIPVIYFFLFLLPGSSEFSPMVKYVFSASFTLLLFLIFISGLIHFWLSDKYCAHCGKNFERNDDRIEFEIVPKRIADKLTKNKNLVTITKFKHSRC